jgi:hypothetical protein
MNFDPAPPNDVIHYYRLLSTEGKWELGFRQMLFGVRVSLSRIGDCCYALDYCAADNPEFAAQLLTVVWLILTRYPEDVTPRQLQDAFPRFERKPINLDPCWPSLLEMALEGAEVAP